MQALHVFASLVLLSVCASAQNYRARYSAGAPGDDPNTNGELVLVISGDSLSYRSALNNAVDVTGVHLHLQGNSSNGLYGGPLLLALTNTTTANGQAPVSSSNGQQLLQQGTKSSTDLQANPQRSQVTARLEALGRPGNPPNNIAELRTLIQQGLVYTDVHTLQRVSPEGLTRGRVQCGDDDDDDDDCEGDDIDDDTDDDNVAAASTGANTGSQDQDDDGNGSNTGSQDSDDAGESDDRDDAGESDDRDD